MSTSPTKRSQQELLTEILAVVQHIQREVKQLRKEQRKMGTEIEDLNAKLDAQAEVLTAFQTASSAATDAIAKEIQQVATLVANATDLDKLKAGVAQATDKIGANNDAIAAATAALVQSTTDLAADDQPA